MPLPTNTVTSRHVFYLKTTYLFSFSFLSPTACLYIFDAYFENSLFFLISILKKSNNHAKSFYGKKIINYMSVFIKIIKTKVLH